MSRYCQEHRVLTLFETCENHISRRYPPAAASSSSMCVAAGPLEPSQLADAGAREAPAHGCRQLPTACPEPQARRWWACTASKRSGAGHFPFSEPKLRGVCCQRCTGWMERVQSRTLAWGRLRRVTSFERGSRVAPGVVEGVGAARVSLVSDKQLPACEACGDNL